MDRLHEMTVFVTVTEAGSLAAAAGRLGLSAATVTRAIAALERRIGAILLQRTTRSVRLTEAGRRYVVDCRRILTDMAEAEQAAAGAHAAPHGALTITASTVFGETVMTPIAAEYLRAHPAVSIRASFVDAVINIAEEGVDVAIRVGDLPDSSLTAVLVGRVRRVVCAAPSYLEQHGTPRRPGELDGHRTIAVASSAGTDWRFARGAARTTVRPRSQLVVSSFQAAITAAALGCGLTRVAFFAIEPLHAAGKLAIVLSEHEPRPVPVHVLYRGGSSASAKVQSFVELCVERLRANPALR